MPAHDGRLMRAALREDLVTAMKARNRDAVTALRTAIAAIDNAEAVDAPGHGQPWAGEHVAGARAGVGATEAERRDLTAGIVIAILRAQVGERITEAERYEAHGQTDAADRLRREAKTLMKYVRE
ncbi:MULTISPECIES: hypothetical protein [unclassified Pseudofrankia]|uniref:hypothetical protein n=1 Tax=unclassified Pseudofrankia TaxID=2994372 RepID=UPI0008DA9795|nr:MULTISPECIES: hypothetical protein [unclassified Pseudofrankia]MDT3440654.1 hypothetical protein [Pseudofrankia sp. BMG5.37]OHV60581.1 hypothetical protein BCD48_05455 [Pseudofrankia sp. BMG5.36]